MNIHSSNYVLFSSVFLFVCLDEVSNKVRLTGALADNEGIVEYYVSESWRTICPDFWSDIQANVVCISLGYFGGTAVSFSTRQL